MAAEFCVRDRRIDETPVAIIDLETTGLCPGWDRVVELSVVRVDPGAPPRLALDTLINPQRPMNATHIHGIRGEDVRHAPTFGDVAGDLFAALRGCVVAAYNVRFDLGFVSAELGALGISHEPPHICLMYMRPLLGLGVRCRLETACRIHGIPFSNAHCAAADAWVSAHLFRLYAETCREQGLHTYADLESRGDYGFLRSLRHRPFPDPGEIGLACGARLCPRTAALPTR